MRRVDRTAHRSIEGAMPPVGCSRDLCERQPRPMAIGLSSVGAGGAAPGGPGAEIASALKPDADDYFVLKPKQSAFFGTPLELLLQHLKASRLILTGVASDQCVLVTATEAGMRDLAVVVPRDCVASQSTARNALVLRQIEEFQKLPTTPSTRLRLIPHARHLQGRRRD